MNRTLYRLYRCKEYIITSHISHICLNKYLHVDTKYVLLTVIKDFSVNKQTDSECSCKFGVSSVESL